jgi:hypothetical protein
MTEIYFASKKFKRGKTNLPIKYQNKARLKMPEEANEPFAIVRAESEFELCKENLVPIYEEYEQRNRVGEEKNFRMLPRGFATKLLKIEGNALFPEDNFNEAEKKALDTFVTKKYVKSAKVAGKKVYFDLDSKIRKYLISVLQRHY